MKVREELFISSLSQVIDDCDSGGLRFVVDRHFFTNKSHFAWGFWHMLMNVITIDKEEFLS